MQEQREAFSYTYSAKEQEEIKKIREKYQKKNPEEDKMEQLRRLDQSVTQKGTMTALILGIVGTLLLGVGMCGCMVWAGIWFVPGIIVGVVGIALIAAAYPMFIRITRQERERIAPEIIRLTEELLK